MCEITQIYGWEESESYRSSCSQSLDSLIVLGLKSEIWQKYVVRVKLLIYYYDLKCILQVCFIASTFLAVLLFWGLLEYQSNYFLSSQFLDFFCKEN